MSTRIEKFLGDLLRKRGLTLVVAESCTGGLVGHRITQAPGSSDYFLGGIIAYSNPVKNRLLGVKQKTLRIHGAVSRETAVEMAGGARRELKADIGLSATGIAGPGGGTKLKPVGLVYVGLADSKTVVARRYEFTGTRNQIKTQAADAALTMLCNYLKTRN